MMVAATSSWAQRAGGTAVRVKSGSDETFGMLAKRMIEAMQATRPKPNKAANENFLLSGTCSLQTMRIGRSKMTKSVIT